ncbi:MAG TPA: GRAS family protein [Polaromonas sp.]|jgi:CBS domain-containing protein
MDFESRLHEAAQAIADGRLADAGSLIDEMAQHLELPRDLNYHIFVHALARRINRNLSGINLYLRELDLAQISLFNLLATHLPIVSMASRIANELLAGYLARREQVVLFDLGIGTAQQEVALLRLLAERNALPQRLTVVAVEPGVTSLQEARRALQNVAYEVQLDMEFVAFNNVAEALTSDEWAAIAATGPNMVVNAAFAAHHIQSTGNGPTAARDEIFRRLRQMDPLAIVLVEPNSDHLNPNFLERYRACWRHFGTVFRFIDSLSISQRDKSAMKLFFSREIDDIVANSEELRAERHETMPSWLARLQRTGFALLGQFPFASLPQHHGVRLVDGEGYQGLVIGDELMTAVLAATSGVPAGTDWVDTRDPAVTAPLTELSAVEAVSVFHMSQGAALRVRDIMSRNIVTIAADATLRQAAEIVERTAASDLAVVDEDGAFLGVLSEGDLIRHMMPKQDATETDSLLEPFELLSINGRARAAERITQLVIEEPIVLKPEDDLMLVADVMISRQIRRLPVVVDGKAVGTVSRADLCLALLGE